MSLKSNTKESLKANFIESERSILFKMAYLLLGIFTVGFLLFLGSSVDLIRGVGSAMFTYSAIIFITDWRNNFYFFKRRNTNTSIKTVSSQLEKLINHSNLVVQLSLGVFLIGLFSTIFSSLTWQKPFIFGASSSLTFLGAIKLSFDLFNNWRRSESLRKLKSD